uniref:Beta-glucosidase n=1 Tax=Panagrolaimus sp. PS1159 TaxID=55785 RepID=A0AC35FFY4_9BILA
MSISPPEVIDCNGFCVSQYQNDGQTLNYTLRCDDTTKYCNAMGCSDNIGTSTKTCCCNNGDLCVHPQATEPIMYNLTKISFSSATAAYQVEGGAFDNRGPSIWDLYVRRPNTIKNNDTGDDACRSYYLWEEDIKLLKAMNVTQYRFSISWTRIFLDGTNKTKNQVGIDYYHKLIKGLIDAGIEPVVTMYHWDLPQPLMDKGGWLNENTAIVFGQYTRFIFEEYSDRVKNWIPINEPLSVVQFEYCGDTHADAPGDFIPHCAWSYYLAAKNMILGHLEAWKHFQDLGLDKKGGKLGIALSGPWFFPNDYQNPDDQNASIRAFEFYWGLFAHPLYRGDWSPIIKDRILNLSLTYEKRTETRLPQFTDDQVKALNGSAQFIGVNYYNGQMVTSRTDDEIANRWDNKLNQEDYDGKIKIWPSPNWRQ